MKGDESNPWPLIIHLSPLLTLGEATGEFKLKYHQYGVNTQWYISAWSGTRDAVEILTWCLKSLEGMKQLWLNHYKMEQMFVAQIHGGLMYSPWRSSSATRDSPNSQLYLHPWGKTRDAVMVHGNDLERQEQELREKCTLNLQDSVNVELVLVLLPFWTI